MRVGLGEPVAVVRMGGVGDGPFHGAQLVIAVEHELDGGLRQWRGLLAHGGDAPVTWHQAVACLGVQVAAQQREQARLAAAVRADHADPPAGMDLQVGFLDQAAGAAGEGELAQLDHDGAGSRRAGAHSSRWRPRADAMRLAAESGTIVALWCRPPVRVSRGDPSPMPSIRRPQYPTFVSRARCWLVALLATLPAVTFAQSTPAVSTLVAFSGSQPAGTPVFGPDGALYGMTSIVNTVTGGLVYRLASDGSGIRTVYSLKITDGYSPAGGVLLGSDDLLYGTTIFGSSNVLNSSGTVFSVSPSGAGFTVLRDFAPYTVIVVDGINYPTNADGVAPSGELVEGSDGYLYGVTSAGGPNGTGVVFKISRDGTDFAVLHAFGPVTDEPDLPGQTGDPDVPPINADGIGARVARTAPAPSSACDPMAAGLPWCTASRPSSRTAAAT